MKNYINLIHKILLEGTDAKDRTGVGTRSIFGTRLEWDLSKSFPAVTTKSLAWNAVVAELLWILSGSSNVEELRERTHGLDSNKFTIWDANYEQQGKALGYKNGNLGPVYGHQWRDFNGVDQIAELIESIKNGVYSGVHSRRNMVTAWNVSDLHKMALPPCHHTFQVYVTPDKKMSLMWHQRSVDTFLGLPFNIASYALLTHILAQLCGCTVDKLIFTGGDTHIYLNHMNAVGELLTRSPLKGPKLVLPKFNSLDTLLSLDSKRFKLDKYSNGGTITAPMAK
jgi:thymidylate synthase